MGLSLTGKVDGTENLTLASNIVNVTDIKNADKAKVVDYIRKANFNRVEKDTVAYTDGLDQIDGPAMKRAIAAHVQKQDGPFADLFYA